MTADNNIDVPLSLDDLPPGVTFYAAPSNPINIKGEKKESGIGNNKQTRVGKVEENEENGKGGEKESEREGERKVGGGRNKDEKVRKTASGSAMAAVKAIGRTRRRSSSRKVRGGAEGEGKAVSSSAIVATGPAKNGPIGYNYLLMPGNNR